MEDSPAEPFLELLKHPFLVADLPVGDEDEHRGAVRGG
jgi:hypothetical protein